MLQFSCNELQLYLYRPSGPHWASNGITLPLLLPLTNNFSIYSYDTVCKGRDLCPNCGRNFCWMLLDTEGQMVAYDKPKRVAWSTYIWCCVWPYIGKHIHLINSTTGTNRFATDGLCLTNDRSRHCACSGMLNLSLDPINSSDSLTMNFENFSI